jgi:hypothetical protein
MIEPIKCYICKKSRVDLFWIKDLAEFICWPCISAAVVVLGQGDRIVNEIPGLNDILISEAKHQMLCTRFGHDWLNQVGFGVFCRRCGVVPSNNGFHLTGCAGGARRAST